MGNKILMTFTADPETLTTIDQRRGQTPRSRAIETIIKRALGMPLSIAEKSTLRTLTNEKGEKNGN